MFLPLHNSSSGRCPPTKRLTHRVIAFVVGTLALLAVAMPLHSFAAPNSMQYQVKAGFLFNFAKFVEWPGSVLAPGASLRLGIVAPPEIYELMEKALSGKTVGDHPLIVEYLTAAQISGEESLPNMIFIHQDIVRLLPELPFTQQQLLTRAENQPVLLVGESAGFAVSGGMIGFVQRGENLRFQVNLANAQRVGLKLSARLSALAEVVKSSP